MLDADVRLGEHALHLDGLTPSSVETMPTSNRVRLALRRWMAAIPLLFALGMAPPASANDGWLPTVQGMSVPGRASAASRYSAALEAGGWYRMRAEFPSHAGEALAIEFSVDGAAVQSSMQSFGVSQDEIEAMRARCNQTPGCTAAEFDQRLHHYYRAHKLRLRTDPGRRPRLFVDIPAVVRETRADVATVAGALRRLGVERGLDAPGVFDAAVALVQGGLAYRTPAQQELGRQTLGFYTPPRTLERGYGDCDTKSALLAAILANLGETDVIGVRVPQHYLLGVARQPRPGETFIEYRNRPYVLLEAAGPAQRRPGEISSQTRRALEAGDEIRIDPMF